MSNDEPTTTNRPTPSSCTTFSNRYRYLILILGLLCLTSISSNMVSLNFTFICMAPPTGSDNSTSIATPTPSANTAPTFIYSVEDKASLIWAVAIGTLMGNFPYTFLYGKHGSKYVLFTAGIISAAATALIPLAAVHSFNAFLLLRFIQGITYSACFSALGIINSRWASLKQNAIFISILTCYSPLSSAITNSISGIMCESRWGWPLVYYTHAAACLLLFTIWIYFYDDYPSRVSCVSDMELEKINRGKSYSHIQMDAFIPYKAILLSPIFSLGCLNAVAFIASGMFLLMYAPSYLKYVLNYSVEDTGFLAALPSLTHIPLKIFFGYASDSLHCLPERQKMIIFNTVAVAVPALLFASVSWFEDPIHVVMVFSSIHMAYSTSGGGFYKMATLSSRQYAHFLIANIQFVKCLCLFIGPALMKIFVADETAKQEWRSIFLLFAVVLFISNLLFCWIATDEPAKFTTITAESWRERKINRRNKTELELGGAVEEVKLVNNSSSNGHA